MFLVQLVLEVRKVARVLLDHKASEAQKEMLPLQPQKKLEEYYRALELTLIQPMAQSAFLLVLE
jgi:hypothetical protein